MCLLVGPLASTLNTPPLLDAELYQIAQNRLSSALAEPQHAGHAAKIREVSLLYHNLSALLPFPTYPITPLKLVLFALAYTPGRSGLAFDQTASHFGNHRRYPRKTAKELGWMLDDLEVMQILTRGNEGVTRFEIEQWVEWRGEILKDFWL